MPPDTKDYHLGELVQAVIAYEKHHDQASGQRMRTAKQLCICAYGLDEVRAAIRQAYALIRFGSLSPAS